MQTGPSSLVQMLWSWRQTIGVYVLPCRSLCIIFKHREHLPLTGRIRTPLQVQKIQGNLRFKIFECINPEVPPPNFRVSRLPNQCPDFGTATFLGLSFQFSPQHCYLHDRVLALIHTVLGFLAAGDESVFTWYRESPLFCYTLNR